MDSQTVLGFDAATWWHTKDADPSVRAIFNRHYSRRRYRDGRQPKHFVGPGEKMVLMTPDATAICIWRKFRSLDRQEGINCAVFRNEGPRQSSVLIRAAVIEARQRWPGARLYTYVDPSAIRSPNPGFCFKRAGWRFCGRTKDRGLHILELPATDAGGPG